VTVLGHSTFIKHSILSKKFISNFPLFCLFCAMPFKPGTFTPTPEQLALREARRLKKQKAATDAQAGATAASSTPPASLVNNEKGHIVPRPWLAADSPANGTLPAKIVTWNVRFFSTRVHSVKNYAISALMSRVFFSSS
jgi:hypothetical protein